MGAPDIRPERPAFMPVIKDIPQAKRPPQKIVNRVSDERKRNNRFGSDSDAGKPSRRTNRNNDPNRANK